MMKTPADITSSPESASENTAVIESAAPATEKTPAEETVATAEKAPVAEKAAATEKAPAVEKTPAAEKASASEKAPAAEKASAEKAPAAEKEATTEKTPAAEKGAKPADAPAANMQTKIHIILLPEGIFDSDEGKGEVEVIERNCINVKEAVKKMQNPDFIKNTLETRNRKSGIFAVTQPGTTFLIRPVTSYIAVAS